MIPPIKPLFCNLQYEAEALNHGFKGYTVSSLVVMLKKPKLKFHKCKVAALLLYPRCAGLCRDEPNGKAGPGPTYGEMDEKVTAVYKGVGLIMKRFTTGKVPKAFKIIPNLQNWEEVS